MPDFPRVGGASAADVWGYSARTITALTGQPRTDLMGEDASFEAGIGTRKARIDAAISTRSSHAAADIWTVAARTITALTGQPRTDLVGTDVTIWSAAARTITALTGAPRTDLLGEDATFEAGTGARKARIDRLANVPVFDTPIEGTITLDGTEQNVVLDEVSGNPSRFLEGHLDLNAMGPTDTLVVRYYISVVSTPTYRKYAEETYSAAQTLPLIALTSKVARYGIKITAQRTAGTFTSLPYQFFRRRIA